MVIGFGLTKDATTNPPAATQCAASLAEGGAQHSITISVMFLVNTCELVEFVTVAALFSNRTARPIFIGLF